MVYVYRNKLLPLESHFRSQWDEEEFQEWMTKIEKQKVKNGVQVMLWVWTEMEK